MNMDFLFYCLCLGLMSQSSSNESKIEKPRVFACRQQFLCVIIISYIIAISDSQLLKKTIIYSFVLP